MEASGTKFLKGVTPKSITKLEDGKLQVTLASTRGDDAPDVVDSFDTVLYVDHFLVVCGFHSCVNASYAIAGGTPSLLCHFHRSKPREIILRVHSFIHITQQSAALYALCENA